MRDPDGHLQFVDGKAVRFLNIGVPSPPFLAGAVARALVADEKMVPFEVKGDRIEAPKLPFITLPTEWVDAQLHAAAMLTLDIAELILAEGHELKDASAWNVIFQGSSPLFCDHLSFQPIAGRQWRAFGQYCRHFTFPLLCAARRGLHGYEAFAIDRDGLTAERTRRLLGPPGLLTLAAPMLLAQGGGDPSSVVHNRSGATLHEAVVRYARAATPSSAGKPKSAWSRYTEERDHYVGEGVAFKRRVVGGWLAASQPGWVMDVGCNTGEFSRLALETGADVIAIDYDHDSVQRVFLEAAGDRRLHTVVANVADLRGGRGWNASEFPSLLDRLEARADVLLMLAVTHHIHLAESIPLDEIADLCRRLTRSLLILELVGEDDPQTRLLAAQYGKDPSAYSVDRQMASFSRHFETVERVAIPGTHRELALLKRS